MLVASACLMASPMRECPATRIYFNQNCLCKQCIRQNEERIAQNWSTNIMDK
jgi:hypothetical protein